MMDIGKRPFPHLPHQHTTFMGREQEIDKLQQMLADPACRLLTLVGPGGVGKTRLALTAVAEAAFADGVYFVPLQPVQSKTAVLSTIANVLGLKLAADITPIQQLSHFLRAKNSLLLLDNLEHVLACADDLSDLLMAVPTLKLLVTSRELLNLQEEWLFPVSGLAVPEDDSDNLLEYGAVALFCDRARRVRPDFSLVDEETAVIKICQLVGGLPLALELAAAWLKTMNCAAIAAEIQNNLDFLSSRLRNVPERHRSMQAVFAQSWQMLTSAAQKMYARLSVFRGGFQREAAERVAEASLAALTELMDKSLLIWDGDGNGRYQMHELLRQFAAKELAQLPDILIRAFHQHCTYYANFVSQHTSSLFGGGQLTAAAAIDAEFDNIRAAWEWAVQHKRFAELRQLMHTLPFYFQLRSRYLDGEQLLTTTWQALDGDAAPADIRALLPVGLAWFALRFGQFERVQLLAEQSLAIYQDNHLPIPLPDTHTSDPALLLGTIAKMRGDYAAAERYLETAVQRSQAPETFYGNRQTAYYQLSATAAAQGDLETAQTEIQAALAAAAKVQDDWFIAHCHVELGNLARQQGDLIAARTHFQASYDLRNKFDDKGGMGMSLARLGDAALAEQNPTAAQDAYNQSIALFEQVFDRGGLATACLGAARATAALHNLSSAVQLLRRALTIADEIDYVQLTLGGLTLAGQLLSASGDTETADRIIATVAQHPATPHDVQTQVTAVHTPPEDLPAIVPLVLHKLAILPESLAVSESKASDKIAPVQSEANQAMIEPLTPRELEILQLIAAGLSNRDIAERLVVVVGTVKAHANNLYGKLGVRTRTQAVARARELGLI